MRIMSINKTVVSVASIAGMIVGGSSVVQNVHALQLKLTTQDYSCVARGRGLPQWQGMSHEVQIVWLNSILKKNDINELEARQFLQFTRRWVPHSIQFPHASGSWKDFKAESLDGIENLLTSAQSKEVENLKAEIKELHDTILLIANSTPMMNKQRMDELNAAERSKLKLCSSTSTDDSDEKYIAEEIKGSGDIRKEEHAASK